MDHTLTNVSVFKELEEFAPKTVAYHWDNVGLQVGSYERPVHKIMITLDVLESVVDEAIQHDVDLIIAHHPLLFKSIGQLDTDSPKGKVIQKLLQHQITVYATHTNLDVVRGGVNDMLCDALGIELPDVLVDEKAGSMSKVAIYVPESHADALRDSLNEAGAGHIGNYSHCSFQTGGQGTFKPLAGTNPYIGTEGTVEKVDEIRMETIVPDEQLAQAIDAIFRAHPYEEPAYDIFPLKNEGETYGLGRIGTLSESTTLEDFAEHVKNALDLPALRMTGDPARKIKRVALLGGSGEDFFQDAYQKGADVFVTGDMTFHAAQDAWQLGLSIIDPGHHIEKVMKEGLQQYLQERIDASMVEIIVSSIDTEPFRFI